MRPGDWRGVWRRSSVVSGETLPLDPSSLTIPYKSSPSACHEHLVPRLSASLERVNGTPELLVNSCAKRCTGDPARFRNIFRAYSPQAVHPPRKSRGRTADARRYSARGVYRLRGRGSLCRCGAANPRFSVSYSVFGGPAGSFAVAEGILSRRYVKSFSLGNRDSARARDKSAKLLDPQLHGPFRLGLPDFFFYQRKRPFAGERLTPPLGNTESHASTAR